MLKYRIDNPDHWNHSLYQQRVNRWIILIEIVLILTAIITSIEVPCDQQGHELAYRLVTFGRGFLIAAAVWFVVSIIVAVLMFLWEWLKGR